MELAYILENTAFLSLLAFMNLLLSLLLTVDTLCSFYEMIVGRPAPDKVLEYAIDRIPSRLNDTRACNDFWRLLRGLWLNR